MISPVPHLSSIHGSMKFRGFIAPRRSRARGPQHQRADSLGIRCREHRRHRRAFGDADQRRSFYALRIHHRAEVVHPLFDRRGFDHPIGEAGPALVEDRDTSETSDTIEQRSVERWFPLQLDVGRETGQSARRRSARSRCGSTRCSRRRSVRTASSAVPRTRTLPPGSAALRLRAVEQLTGRVGVAGVMRGLLDEVQQYPAQGRSAASNPRRRCAGPRPAFVAEARSIEARRRAHDALGALRLLPVRVDHVGAGHVAPRSRTLRRAPGTPSRGSDPRPNATPCARGG